MAAVKLDEKQYDIKENHYKTIKHNNTIKLK